MERLVLDLGIGEGGTYLLFDPLTSTRRFGLDKSLDYLKRLRAKHNVDCTRFDVDLLKSRGYNLPFRDSLFDQVQVFFPLDELLSDICDNQSRLWQELHRVVKDGGQVGVVVDVNRQENTSPLFKGRNGEIVAINSPHQKIFQAAAQNGFKTELDLLREAELAVLRTEVSDSHVRYHGNRMLDFFKITATKLPL